MRQWHLDSDHYLHRQEASVYRIGSLSLSKQKPVVSYSFFIPVYISDYRIVILCSSEQDESSHIVTALDTYRRDVTKSETQETTEYLYIQYQEDVRAVNKDHREAAGNIAPHW